MKCPSCSSDNREGAAFCDTCGNPQSIDTKSQASPQLAQKILSERGRIEGERRTVTVLFADAKGFTPLSERLDAEQVYSFMQTCYERMVAVVHRQGRHDLPVHGRRHHGHLRRAHRSRRLFTARRYRRPRDAALAS